VEDRVGDARPAIATGPVTTPVGDREGPVEDWRSLRRPTGRDGLGPLAADRSGASATELRDRPRPVRSRLRRSTDERALERRRSPRVPRRGPHATLGPRRNLVQPRDP